MYNDSNKQAIIIQYVQYNLRKRIQKKIIDYIDQPPMQGT